jgi:hypothetical protein
MNVCGTRFNTAIDLSSLALPDDDPAELARTWDDLVAACRPASPGEVALLEPMLRRRLDLHRGQAARPTSPGILQTTAVLALGLLCALAVNALLPSGLAVPAAMPAYPFVNALFQERIRPMSSTTAEPTRPRTSEAKINSNRLNSKRSTGPRTEAGKNTSKI